MRHSLKWAKNSWCKAGHNIQHATWSSQQTTCSVQPQFFQLNCTLSLSVSYAAAITRRARFTIQNGCKKCHKLTVTNIQPPHTSPIRCLVSPAHSSTRGKNSNGQETANDPHQRPAIIMNYNAKPDPIGVVCNTVLISRIWSVCAISLVRLQFTGGNNWHAVWHLLFDWYDAQQPADVLRQHHWLLHCML